MTTLNNNISNSNSDCKKNISPLTILRESANLKQVDIATASGLPQSTISQLESGYLKPRVKNIAKLATIFKADFDQLFNECIEFYNINRQSIIAKLNLAVS